MKKFITRADIILLIVLVAVGLAASAFLSLSKTAGDTVEIESNGKLYATYKLSSEQTVEVKGPNGGTNIVKIHDGKVCVSEASCKNQVCVKHSSISESGESIVCLPNKLMVTIKGSGGDKYDATSN